MIIADFGRAFVLVMFSALFVVAANAQTAGAAPAGKAASTPAQLPPGATSARGDKAAVPASGVASGINPDTGSTSGSVPGAGSAKGDKAATPRTPNPAASASR
jgi:hypothetical protein